MGTGFGTAVCNPVCQPVCVTEYHHCDCREDARNQHVTYLPFQQEPFTVHLRTGMISNRPLGLISRPDKNEPMCLTIDYIADHSLISSWNKENDSAKQILIGDLILTVNGVSGNTSAMTDAMIKAGLSFEASELTLEICHREDPKSYRHLPRTLTASDDAPDGIILEQQPVISTDTVYIQQQSVVSPRKESPKAQRIYDYDYESSDLGTYQRSKLMTTLTR